MLTKINNAYKQAMLNKDETKKKVLNTLKSEIKNLEISLRPSGKELTDADIMAVIQKMIKQDKESIGLFKQGNRQDLVDNTTSEINILQEFLPTQISGDELKSVLKDIIKEVNAQSLKDMGKIMGVVKTKLAGQVDMSSVSAIIKEILSC